MYAAINLQIHKPGESTNILVKVFVKIIKVHFLLNITCSGKTHEVFAARQHGSSLIKRNLVSHFHGTDVKIGVLEGSRSERKWEVDLGDIVASKPDANDDHEMLERRRAL